MYLHSFCMGIPILPHVASGQTPKIYLQHWGYQLWLRLRISDQWFSKGGNFEKLSSCADKVLQTFCLYTACPIWKPCQWSRQDYLLTQQLVFLRRKQISDEVSSVSNILLGTDQGYKEQLCLLSTEPNLFKCQSLQFFEVIEDNVTEIYLCLARRLD